MNSATENNALPSLVKDRLVDAKHGYIDNLFADTWKVLSLNRWIKTANLTKRSGIETWIQVISA